MAMIDELKFLVWISKFLPFFVANLSLISADADDIIHSITKSSQNRNHAPGELIFSDEFDTFDLERWHHENTLGGAGWDFQMYTNSRTISFVRNGTLFIKPSLTADVFGVHHLYNGQWALEGSYPENICTDVRHYGCKRAGHYPNLLNPVMSANLQTLNSFYFKYGRVEIRAKLPGGDWMRSMIGMVPRFNGYGSWPLSGDIRIVESLGNQLYFDGNERNLGAGRVTCAAHHGPHWSMDGWPMTSGDRNLPPGRGYDQDFHIYGLKWTDEYIEFTVDGIPMRTTRPEEGGFWDLCGFEGKGFSNPWKHATNKRMAPYDQKFFLVMMVSVGGSSYSDYNINKKGKKPWRDWSPISFLEFFEGRHEWQSTWVGEAGALQIDYIRVYAI